jgi:hypothetical protein
MFVASAPAFAGLIATYTFNNTLAASQPGVAALTAVDPLGTSGFQTATVLGNSRTTWHFDGSTTPASQGGLQFNTTGLIASNQYSVEMLFELTGNSGWRRLLDSLDRQSDSGLYIDPANNLDLYPNGSGSGGPFVANSFFDVFVTIDPSNTVNGYLNGAPQFSLSSTNLDVATNTLGFFLDNVVAGGQGEWSSGNIALIKVFNTALTVDQVAAESRNPFGTPTGAPEPGTWMLMLGAAAGFAFCKRRVTGGPVPRSTGTRRTLAPR